MTSSHRCWNKTTLAAPQTRTGVGGRLQDLQGIQEVASGSFQLQDIRVLARPPWAGAWMHGHVGLDLPQAAQTVFPALLPTPPSRLTLGTVPFWFLPPKSH